jgi:Flp pilus assembly protein TadD
LGLAWFYHAEYAKAEKALKEAVRLAPQNALFWSNLAAAVREQDRLGEAEQILLERALALDATLPIAHMNLGVVYLRGNRPDLAVQPLEAALRLTHPDSRSGVMEMLRLVEDPASWLRLVDQLLLDGDPEGALAALEQAEQLGAEPADVAAGLSVALVELGALSEAEAVLQQALAQFPNDARLHNNMGVVARERGDLRAAREHFSRAATLAPEWSTPQENLASLRPPSVP